MKTVTLDWETYYDTKSGYTLKKMRTEDYVTDPRFQVIGVSAQIGDGDVRWFSDPSMDRIKDWLTRFNIPASALACHHMIFDGLILQHHFGIVPRMYICTESLARPLLKPRLKSLSLASLSEFFDLPAKGDEVIFADGMRLEDFSLDQLETYGEYCRRDTWLCREIFKRLMAMFPKTAIREELQILDLTLRMFMQPQLDLDAEVFERCIDKVVTRKKEIIADMEVRGITAKTLRSKEKFAEVLRDRGIEPPLKISPASLRRGDNPPTLTYAFAKNDPEFINLREEYAEDLEMTMILNARISEMGTLEERRSERMLKIAREHHHLRAPLNYYSAHTGRYGGCEKINVQNPPGMRISEMRRGFVAPKGFKVVAADLSQIEARAVAVLAGQDDLVEVFRRGDCPYSHCATDLFGTTVTKALAAEDEAIGMMRKTGKAIILGSGFGMGGPKFQGSTRKDGLNLSLEEATRYIMFFRERYSMIPRLWGLYDEALTKLVVGREASRVGPFEFVWLEKDLAAIIRPNGLPLLYPRLRMIKPRDEYPYVGCNQARDKFPRRLWGGTITENVVQSICRDIVMRMMVLLHQRTGLRPALQVHDEIVLVVPDARLDEVQQAIAEIMTTPYEYLPDLPLAFEVGVGQNYGDCK